ncbi:hypothetical protein, partial [Caballeronia sordidicola]|uniref:hypothetical protein n=1 Tax=Caballeronia sordidicola TaxID=196367 RepID=UPI001F20DD17
RLARKTSLKTSPLTGATEGVAGHTEPTPSPTPNTRFTERTVPNSPMGQVASELTQSSQAES